MDQPAVYRITVMGQIDARLAAWLGNMQLNQMQNPQGENISVLTGLLYDQAALIGVLVHLYNRGHCLLGLERTISTLDEELA
jgi:hypothetical protein